jgi:hypothetical protein
MSYAAIDNKAIQATEYFHVSRLLQDSIDHKPDPWLRLVIRRALDIVCKNKIFDGWEFEVEKWFEGATLNASLKYDRDRSRKKREEYSLGNIFPLPEKKTTLVCDMTGIDGREQEASEIQGKQFPDYVVIISAKNTRSLAKSRIAMVFEGEPHGKDHNKKNNGMFLYQKMFHDAAFCQDINPDISAIFIALAMMACEDTGPSGNALEFPEWTQALLESCVLLVTRLFVYTLDMLPGKDFIGEELGKIGVDKTKRTYDLYCWINVEHKGSSRIQYDALTCFDQFSSGEILDGDTVNANAADATGTKVHNCEFMRILQYNNKISNIENQDRWPLLSDNSDHTFYAKKIKFECKKMPTTILAVERATKTVDSTGAVNMQIINRQIDMTNRRIQRLNVQVQKYRSAKIGPPVPPAVIIADLDDLIIDDLSEIKRLQASLAKLQARVAGTVIRSRGMWYPNNVQEILDTDKMNRKISDLTPLCDFMDPIVNKTDTVNFQDIGTKQRFDYSDQAEFDKYNGHIYLTLPWLWVNIGFLFMLNRKLQYEWTKVGKPLKLMDDFKNQHVQGKWRGGAGCEVEVQMFPKASKTLFARLCSEMSKKTQTVEIDPTFETFLFETCGWQDCNEPQSPAMFFRLLGVSNVKTGCLISSNMLKTPNPRFEGIKKTFPLNAQVEIDYAVEALAATIYHKPP